MQQRTRALTPAKRIRADQVDFTDATPVISAAQKYVVPVPAFPGGGDPLVYPCGDDKAGLPLTDWQGEPIGERGVVFWNLVDSCWQGAPGDGTAIIIFNDVSQTQAGALHKRFLDLQGDGPMTLAALRLLLDYAESIGLGDRYSSDNDYLAAHLTPVKPDACRIELDGLTMGFVKRDDRDVAMGVYVDTPFEFTGSKVGDQDMPQGGVIVRLGESIHAVQPDVFLDTYRLADGGQRVENLARDVARLVHRCTAEFA